MAIIDVFKKKAGETALPVDKVLQMKQQGLSSSQVTEALQREGFSTDQIFQAMSHAELKGGVEGTQMYPQPPVENPMVFPAPPAADFSQQMPQQFQGQQAAPPSQMQQSGQEGISAERIEEIAEAIIDEKWKELVKQVNKIIDWKERTDADIIKLKADMDNLIKGFNQLNSSVIERVGEYDRNIKSVSTDLKALEQVFKDALPGFVENIQELSRITQTMKEKGK